MAEEGSASRRWGEMLSEWAIPEDILAAAPTAPYFFDPKVFVGIADESLARIQDTPSDAVARGALPTGGSVLDVGCGAGSASLRLNPGLVTGVDPSSALLEAFAERAARLGIEATTLEGVWPEAAFQAPLADVAVCHHVLYNVSDAASFLTELTRHAGYRVVIELTAMHPMAWMTPYWEALHGLHQPDRPVADDALAVLAELGLDVHEERWRRPYQMIGETADQSLARIARRLCLPPERYDELRRLLSSTPPPSERDMVTFWWRG
jgi:SAM-dependent methyltransferase